MFKKKISYKKIALALSLCLVAMWILLGTGASLAWFSDETENLRNIFHYAEFELEVSYKNDGMDDYELLESENAIFDDEALYEPGYTEIVFLRVSNAGSLALKYNLMFNLKNETAGINVYGDEFKLSDYLELGSYRMDEYNGDANYADIFSCWSKIFLCQSIHF